VSNRPVIDRLVSGAVTAFLTCLLGLIWLMGQVPYKGPMMEGADRLEASGPSLLSELAKEIPSFPVEKLRVSQSFQRHLVQVDSSAELLRSTLGFPKKLSVTLDYALTCLGISIALLWAVQRARPPWP
jgi:hypothetical protein